MSGRVGRDHHSRRDNMPHHHPRHQNHHSSSSSSSFRYDENKSGRGKNPPSRHLWVGNLSHHIDQSTLTDEFIRFGKLENIAFHPGRSYAFINFVREDDAIEALNSLQGYSLAGMPLRIEFAKSDKSSAPPRDELYLQHRNELPPRNRSSAFSPRESRKRHASPDAYFPDSPRTNEHGTDHPTEILWIGYPSCLKVDETILRKAFSPFGIIDKITAFPGRTYAFVQFRNLASACRAKETLQGKLFGNPRVHISFARKEHAPSAGGRRNMEHDFPPSPHYNNSAVQAGSSDHLYTDRHFRESEDPTIRAPHFPNMEYGDPDITNFSRLDSPWTHRSGPYEDRRFHELGPDVVPPQGSQGYCRSPLRDGSAHFHDFSPQKLQRKSSFPDDLRELPEDTFGYHGRKKLKVDSFPHEELPEYPLHNVDQDKHVFPGFVPELPLSDEYRPPIPFRRPPENPSNINRSLGSKHDDWGSSHNSFRSPPPTSSSVPVEWKQTTAQLHQPGPKEWKWEGTIAKGGTPVCQARCFPVGKVMDFFLPDFLDCTARTGLDMLAKHYYQSTCSWVVFFVPASDTDMGYYNEFMHYLGEKQRAAVAKLDDRNTLFLVPPSDFSQNVLKIPGKLSISGVVLSLEPSSPTIAAHPPENEMKYRGLTYSHVDTSYSKLQLPSGSSHIPGPYPASLQGNNRTSAPSLVQSYGRGSGSIPYHMENRYDFQPGNSVLLESSVSALPVPEGHSNSVSGWGGPEISRVNYDGGTSYSDGNKSVPYEYKLQSAIPSLPPGGLHQEQLADAASSFRGTQRQTTNCSPQSASEVFRFGNMGNQSENMTTVPPRHTAPQTTNQVSGMSPSPFSQQQHQTLLAESVRSYPHAAPVKAQGSQENVNVGGNAQDDMEADPQKRLQATLQLAAALLQQIQQGKGT